MSELEQILEPIAGSNPCGVDLEYDSRFQAVKDLVEAGSEEHPTDWKAVKKQCLELLNDGRSIELLVLLAVSLVAVEGYSGLQSGLHILAKSVEEFWDTIYPELDMEDPEPDRYEMRLNIIAQLGEMPRKLGDKLCFVERILRASLSLEDQRISACFWPIWESDNSENADVPDLGSTQDYISRMSFDNRKALTDSVEQSMKHLQQLSSFLMESTGQAYNGPFDEHLLPALKLIHDKLNNNEQAPVPSEATASTGEEVASVSQNVSAPPPPPPGTINSREDVKKALDKIIEYYRQNEPSSPVPYLAKRTKELVDADFMDVIRNLSKESEHQFMRTLNLEQQ